MLVERRFDERANDSLVFLQVVLSRHLALLGWCCLGADEGTLGWPIDSWLQADDCFFAACSKWMTYSPGRDDLDRSLGAASPHERAYSGCECK
jgi:hypothetical protein